MGTLKKKRKREEKDIFPVICVDKLALVLLCSQPLLSCMPVLLVRIK